MSKEKKIIPELRFPEFVKDGKWEECSIVSIGDVVTGGTPSKSNKEFWGGDFVWVTAQDFHGKYISDSVLKLTQKGKAKSKVIPQNSVLVTCIASIGLNGINKVECATNQQINSVICNSQNDFEFVYYAISKNSNRLKNLAGQTAVPIISKSIFETFTIYKPKSLPEQQKIAACLSSLDELIAAHRDKLQALQDHKKGLMQNLFPQKGQKVPNYRFPEFVKDGEWKEETIRDVYDFKGTNSFSRENLNYEKGKVKNIHYGDIHTKFNTLFDITREHVPYINGNVSIEKIKKESYCVEGDMIFADASEDMNDIGKSIEIVNLNNEKLVSGLHTLLARQRKRKIANGFGGYLFKSEWVRKQIQREAQGAKVLGISATRISNVKILYPRDFNEQQKIVACLSALDELIVAQTEKIEKLQQHKKGLMQGLFPKMDD
ncbi:restriction endonuclease subunit S [candidate division KSB1 bacterium]|nr:restriction endonuclease subunit S [candidate division KSB1 bacterium]